MLCVWPMRQGVLEVIFGLGHPLREIVVVSGIFCHNLPVGAAAVKDAANWKAERVQSSMFERSGEQVVQDKPAEALEVQTDHADGRDQALD
ncbi:MAG: hypothetical protein ACLPIG_02980 [Methylocella sp.]